MPINASSPIVMNLITKIGVIVVRNNWGLDSDSFVKWGAFLKKNWNLTSIFLNKIDLIQINGFTVFNALNRPKSRSALHSTETPFSIQTAAIRAS